MLGMIRVPYNVLPLTRPVQAPHVTNHLYTHTHGYTHTGIHMHTDTHTHTQIHTQMGTHRHAHSGTDIKCTDKHIQCQTYTDAHVNTNTHTHTHTHTRARECTYSHTHTNAHTCRTTKGGSTVKSMGSFPLQMEHNREPFVAIHCRYIYTCKHTQYTHTHTGIHTHTCNIHTQAGMCAHLHPFAHCNHSQHTQAI